jgi:hypothetical protein
MGPSRERYQGSGQFVQIQNVISDVDAGLDRDLEIVPGTTDRFGIAQERCPVLLDNLG